MKKRIRWHLVLPTIAVSAISVFFTVQISTARPSQLPPIGSPTWPPGNPGIQGPQGSKGNTGQQGNTGASGPAGDRGDFSYVKCNWTGMKFFNHGWDAGTGGQSHVGVEVTCSGSVVTSMNFRRRNGISWACPREDGCGGP